MPSFVADENIPGAVISALRANGFHVVSISETRPRLPDTQVLAQATELAFILITADNDFGELVFLQQREIAGVILLRLHGLSPQTRADTVLDVVREHGARLSGAFTVVSPGQVRIRPR